MIFMKRKIKRVIVLLLAVLMLTASVVACAKDPEPVDTGTAEDSVSDVVDSNSETEIQWETDEQGFVKDTITSDMTYNGKEIKILGWKYQETNTLPPSGDYKNNIIAQALYNQRLEVEERLDVFFEIEYVPASWQESDQLLTKVRNGQDYDLIQTYSLWPMTLACEGYLKDLNDLTYPALEMPWWPESTTEWEQYGSLFFVANNSSVLSFKSMMVMYANSDLITSRGVEDPVDVFLRGEWYIDTMLQYVKKFESDPDYYGLNVGAPSWMDCLYYGSGFNSTKNNADGVAELAFADDTTVSRITSLLDKLIAGFSGDEVYFDFDNDGTTAFKNKSTAFHIGPMSDIELLQDSETYAVLTTPKLDENQTEYRVIQNNGYDTWCVPATADDPELSGVVIEAIASSEYRTIAPLYFEKYLKLRYSSDAKGVECFNLIRHSIMFDFGRICQYNFGVRVENLWRNCFSAEGELKSLENNYSSNHAEAVSTCEIKLKEILRNMRKYS